jgi:hypothetical protein
VIAGLRLNNGLFALLLSAAALPANNASAISLDIARKCNGLLAKEFPPREAGNPAAGSTKGNGQAERAYFNKCVANNGNMDNAPSQNPTPTPSPTPAPK